MKYFVPLIIAVFAFLGSGCSREEKVQNSVVLYTSQDQVYSEPILRQFTEKTGIQVRALYDSESAKTAGLAHRLRYEAQNPVCDLFWNNEELHTRMLAREKVLEPAKWKSFGYRTRRLVINTDLLSAEDAPRSLLELTNSRWRGKFTFAYPLFGTTGIHFLALRQHWGEEQWKRWAYGLVRNSAKVVDGNSMVVKLVGAGEAAIGLTDSDDIAAGIKQGLPIQQLPVWAESLLIPNTVGLVTGASNPENATTLMDYLLSPETQQRLLDMGAIEGVDPGNLKDQTLPLDWSSSLTEFQEAANFLRVIFVRS